MNDRLTEIFKIISFYDDCRWEHARNYNSINLYKEGLSPDAKILTHWLCYITDRQMSFKRIWDIGGFVFSELICELKAQKTLNILNPNFKEPFVKKDMQGKFAFISKSIAGNNAILLNYNNISANKRVEFKSRFFPSDYLAILYTLAILEDYKFSFSKFIKEVFLKHKNKKDFIKRILFSLFLMTYEGVGQPRSDELNRFEENLEKAIKHKNKIKEILWDTEKFDYEYHKFKFYEQKRAWCSLRDFIKSPEFKVLFEEALRSNGLRDDDFSRLFSHEALAQLELPGDVWNNNSKFRKCILKNTEYENSNQSLNRILRDFYDKNPHIVGYPEQFDITFDFVPKMCELNNCKICPIYRIDNQDNNFQKLCSQNESMYCPVALVGCNYHNNCFGKDRCKLL